METADIRHLVPVQPGDSVLVVTRDGPKKRGLQVRTVRVRRTWLSKGNTLRLEPFPDGYFRPGTSFDRRACIAISALEAL